MARNSANKQSTITRANAAESVIMADEVVITNHAAVGMSVEGTVLTGLGQGGITPMTFFLKALPMLLSMGFLDTLGRNNTRFNHRDDAPFFEVPVDGNSASVQVTRALAGYPAHAALGAPESDGRICTLRECMDSTAGDPHIFGYAAWLSGKTTQEGEGLNVKVSGTVLGPEGNGLAGQELATASVITTYNAGTHKPTISYDTALKPASANKGLAVFLFGLPRPASSGGEDLSPTQIGTVLSNVSGLTLTLTGTSPVNNASIQVGELTQPRMSITTPGSIIKGKLQFLSLDHIEHLLFAMAFVMNPSKALKAWGQDLNAMSPFSPGTMSATQAANILKGLDSNVWSKTRGLLPL